MSSENDKNQKNLTCGSNTFRRDFNNVTQFGTLEKRLQVVLGTDSCDVDADVAEQYDEGNDCNVKCIYMSH